MEEPTHLGERVRKQRTECGISQIALARAVGVSATAIFKLESGDTRMLYADHLLRIAIELGANPYLLVFGEHSAEFRHFGLSNPAAQSALLSALSPDRRALLNRIINAFLEEADEHDRRRKRTGP